MYFPSLILYLSPFSDPNRDLCITTLSGVFLLNLQQYSFLIRSDHINLHERVSESLCNSYTVVLTVQLQVQCICNSVYLLVLYTLLTLHSLYTFLLATYSFLILSFLFSGLSSYSDMS